MIRQRRPDSLLRNRWGYELQMCQRPAVRDHRGDRHDGGFASTYLTSREHLPVSILMRKWLVSPLLKKASTCCTYRSGDIATSNPPVSKACYEYEGKIWIMKNQASCQAWILANRRLKLVTTYNNRSRALKRYPNPGPNSSSAVVILRIETSQAHVLPSKVIRMTTASKPSA